MREGTPAEAHRMNAIGRVHAAGFVRWQWIWPFCALGLMTIGRLALAALLRRWRSQGRLTSRIAIVGYGMLSERLI